MPDDTKAAALYDRLEAIIMEAEDAEAQAAAARRRIQAVSACYLHLHLCILRSQPRSLSPPPLRPTKTGLLPDFTFRQLQCSTSASY
jgi:hypothetical protein